jgi:trehalose 6-phosphate synthase/phosphatase
MRPSVVIVSNRLPISVKKNEDGKLEFYPSVGGLATGLSSYVKDKRNKWIGWPGIPSDKLTDKEQQQIADELRKQNCYPVFLKQKQLDDFYNGYSNTILWPLFHDLPAPMDDHEKFWRAYKSVNRAFGDAVLALSESGSTIWVHDYQLLLLPAQLRAARPDAKIGFFLHIPFPSPAHFKKLPSGQGPVGRHTGSDLVGLHTKSYVENFLGVTGDLTSDVVGPGQVILGDRVIRVTDFPMGIDYERFVKARDLKTVKSEVRKHRRKYRGMKVILTVDRLDPTKGLAERLEAYYEFLRQSPALHGKVVMAMLAVPSRTEIDEYKKLREKVEGLVAKINGEFGTAKWQPVDYMYTSLPVESVTALYQVADIAFITPIRDGMNLVAKEYIASKPKNDGVLILSETAGAAQELTNALLVNPKKPNTMVDALKNAVSMPQRELRSRLGTMHEQIQTHTVQSWAGTFMKTLQRPAPPDVSGRVRRHMTRLMTIPRADDMCWLFREARHRALFLDYDGVLAPFASKPEDADPTPSLKRLLEKLASKQDTQLAIISGRSRDDLQAWFGDLPVTLVAEHGALVRKAGNKNWHSTMPALKDWQYEIELILEQYAAKTPGAFVEHKKYSLVWHYRKANNYYAQKNLVILKRLLREPARKYHLSINSGNKILEIKPVGINKGAAALGLLGTSSNGQNAPEFILSIGDDYTDEDMFTALPMSAYTVKVGRGITAARYRLPDVSSVHRLLNKLAR